MTEIEAATHLEEYEYEDPSGSKITIPAECAVSQVEGENTLADGLVIIDANGNEWVWVEVPRTEEVYPTAGIDLDEDNITDDECTTIYNDLANYASAYRDNNYSDTFYSQDQTGFEDADAYNEAKNNMIRSVYKYGGFWIGRYEVGIADSDRFYGNDYYTEHPITEMPVIKANAYPYNYVRCSQAQTLSQQLSTGGKTGSLMFGIQWNLTCKFLEKSGLTISQINSDSSSWGNYYSSLIKISKGKYNKISSRDLTSEWLNIIPGIKNDSMLLTTGASEDTKKMNIYDFAGNVWKFTLETNTNDIDSICTARGGYYDNDPSRFPASVYSSNSTTYSRFSTGFRVSLY